MHLSNEQAHDLLGKHGVFALECCDKCGRILGAVRYTRRGESGEWCSRECRGNVVQVIRRGGRPRKYRNGVAARAAKTAQQRDYRSRSSVEKTVCRQSETKDLQAQKALVSTTPLYPAISAAGEA